MFTFFTSILWYKNGTLAWKRNKDKKIRKIIPQKCKYEVVFKILKNLKSNLTPKKVILCSTTLSLLWSQSWKCVSQTVIFLTIVWPPPCIARCVLSCVDISCFISALITLAWRFNAASKKENNTEGIYIHMFYIQMSIHAPIKSFIKTTPSPLNQALQLLLVTTVVD